MNKKFYFILRDLELFQMWIVKTETPKVQVKQVQQVATRSIL